ncbi:MAG: hypothetical protein FWC32_01350, partial [Firmicutes bacterium]|nr:hypothetical protein [Bacillota bacterium]
MKRPTFKKAATLILAIAMVLVAASNIFADSFEESGGAETIAPHLVIWSMQTDDYIQGLEADETTTLAGTPWLSRAGTPTVTAVANLSEPDLNSLQVTDRPGADWQGLEIPFRTFVNNGTLSPVNTYQLVVQGQAITPIPGPTNMVLRQAQANWSNLSATVAVTNASPYFTLTFEFSPNQANLVTQNAIRIQTTQNVTTSFIIDSIVLTRTAIGPASFTLTANGEAGVKSSTEIVIEFIRDIAPPLDITHITTFNPRDTGVEMGSLRRVPADDAVPGVYRNDMWVLEVGNITHWGSALIGITHPDVAAAAQNVGLFHDGSYFTPPLSPRRDYFPDLLDPNFADIMPYTPYLNDPFTFFWYTVGAQRPSDAYPADGIVATQEHWELRRAELQDLFMYYYYGFIWPTTHNNVTVNLTEAQINTNQTADAARNLGAINITVNEHRLDGTPIQHSWNGATGVNLPSWQQLYDNGFWCCPNPCDINAPCPGSNEVRRTGGPVIVGGAGGSNAAALHARGIGLADAPGAEARTSAYFTLFPFNPDVVHYNTGSLAARAWEVGRLIDIFQLNPQLGVNYNAFITTGNSFAGKRALSPGVFDDRVAVTMPHESGGDGGVAPFRFSHAGRIQYYHADTFAAQESNRVHSRHETMRTGLANRRALGPVAERFATSTPYEQSTHLLPFDMHLAIALTSPTLANPNRAFVSLETANFGTWTAWAPARTVAAAAQEVFHFLDSDNLIFLSKNSSHSPHASDAPVWLAVVDYLFGQPVHDTETGFRGGRTADQVYVEDINNVAYPGIWPSPGYLTRSPIEVQSDWMPWARPGYYAVWTETVHVTEGLPATVVAHTTAPDGTVVTLTARSTGDQNRLWNRNGNAAPVVLDTWTAVVSGGQAIFNIPPTEVQIGRYELSVPNGGRSAFFQGIDVHTALRSGSTQDNIGGSAATLFGFTSTLVNRDELQLFILPPTGEEVPVTATTWQGGGNWITPWGVRIQGTTGTGAYILRNLQFEAMPGFTFEMSFQQNLHVGGWNTGQPDQPAIWRPSPAVQHIGPYPHWLASGTGARPHGNEIGTIDNRPTNFSAHPTSHTLVNNVWTIEFPAAINPRDFGIGFNFSGDFTLAWSNDNTQLDITFNDFDPAHGQELVMYISRIRAAEGPAGAAAAFNYTYNTYIRYSFIADLGVIDPAPSFDIFNNGEGGSPSRPNASLAAAGIIRMWTQLDGINTPVYLAAADTIIALDQDGECAEEFVRVGRVWQDGTGWLDYFNLVDVNKNGAWQYINFYITVYGQTVHLLLVNANYTPQPPPE